MSSPASTSAGGVLLVTPVYPPQLQGTPQQGTQTSIRAELLTLGTVQIMIGVMVALFGIIAAIPATFLGASGLIPVTGFFVWGAGFYVTSGSLTVAAGKSSNPCVAKTSLGFNILASVSSVVAIVSYTMDATGMFTMCYDDDSNDCYLYKTRMQGFAGVLAVFHVLEFVISITAAVFACRVICNHDIQQPQQVYVVPGNAPLAAHAPPASYVPPGYMAHPPPQVVSSPKPEGQINPGLTEPPAYTQMPSQQF